MKLSLPTTASILGSGPNSYSLFALDGASLYAWGNNYYGQLGLGTTGTSEPTPKLVPLTVLPY
ncbi:MAG: RCC1-like domain-containing protein [Myxococcota bacterium]